LSFAQRSVDWQAELSCAVHATHALVAASQTWCMGSHAAQSALVLHLIVGLPAPSVGHVWPFWTHVPADEHSCPAGHGFFASHATHRFEARSHVCRPSEHVEHSASFAQLWSRQMPVSAPPPIPPAPPTPVAPPAPPEPVSPPAPPTPLGVVVVAVAVVAVVAPPPLAVTSSELAQARPRTPAPIRKRPEPRIPVAFMFPIRTQLDGSVNHKCGFAPREAKR
jgi:hypothetical protein